MSQREDWLDCDWDVASEVHQHTIARDEAPSTAVTLAVADVLDADVVDLPPLRDVIELDALDSLFVAGDGDVRVEFRYAGCLVAIRRGTELFVSEAETVE